MQTRLLNLWEKLRSSYWFIPTLMAVIALLLAVAAIWADENWTLDWLWESGWAYRNEPEGARALLSTVAGGIITVAGVVFSVTIVALTLASQQFGPRLLYNFMRDRGNQIVFGTFIATYLYSLVILRTIRQGDDSFVPHLAIFVGFLLAVASLGVLIYFIHHAAASIQAMTIIDTVHRDLQKMLVRLFPQRYEESAGWQWQAAAATVPDDFAQRAASIAAKGDGYLQAIDREGLLEVAAQHDLLIRLEYRPGHYLIAGSVLARVLPGGAAAPGRWEDDIRQAFILGRQRTQEQDVEFLIQELVEIAVRALSPGINDPHTAITCVDRLGSVLAALAGRAMPDPLLYDARGNLRLITKALTYAGIVDASLDQIRQYGLGSVAVTIRFLEMIAAVLPFTRDEAQRQPLLRQAALLHRGSGQAFPEEFDRAAIHARYLALLEILEREFGIAPP